MLATIVSALDSSQRQVQPVMQLGLDLLNVQPCYSNYDVTTNTELQNITEKK